VTCQSNVLFITFSNQKETTEFLTHLHIGNILVGGNQLGCVNATTGKRSIIVREVISLPQVSGSTITLRTKPAGMTQVLKNAEASMDLNPIEMQAMASCNTGDLLSGQCTASLSTGTNFQGWTKDYSGHTFWSQNIGGATASLTCSSCYASFVPQAKVNINIVNNNINLLQLQILGTATVQVQVTAALKASFSANGDIPIFSFSLPSVTFFIGAFPVHLDFNVPIKISWYFSTTGTAQIQTGITLTDTMMGGLQYDGNGVSPMKSNSFSTQLQSPTATVSSSAQLTVYLVPELDITFEDVCTLGIAVKPFLQVSASQSNSRLSGQVNAGLQVDISADIGAQLDGHQIGPQKTFGPATIFNQNTNLYSG
jgi:hypothetical protein